MTPLLRVRSLLRMLSTLLYMTKGVGLVCFQVPILAVNGISFQVSLTGFPSPVMSLPQIDMGFLSG